MVTHSVTPPRFCLKPKLPLPDALGLRCTHKSNYPPQSPLVKGGSRKSSSLLKGLVNCRPLTNLAKGRSRKSSSLLKGLMNCRPLTNLANGGSRKSSSLPFPRGGLGWGKTYVGHAFKLKLTPMVSALPLQVYSTSREN